MSSLPELGPMAGVLALALARPLGLVALVLPLALLAASLRRTRPEPRVTGTFALWDAGPGGRGRRARRLPPAAIWCAAAALALGAVALAGPRGAAEERRTWTVVLDTSPSMGLPVPGAGETRAAAGVARARALLARSAGEGDRVRWLSARAGELLLAPGEVPSAEWSRPADRAGEEPRFETFDRPGVVVVTDAPARPPLEWLTRAGVVVTGAAPVPGPLGAEGRDLLVWTGEDVVRRSGGLTTRRVALRRAAGGPALPVLERVVRAWAQGRGMLLDEAAEGPELALVVSLEGDPLDERAALLERDGWSARGRVGGQSRASGGGWSERWLEAVRDDGTRVSAVEARPGLVRTTLTALAEPLGDPASFAVSWAELFDRWSLVPEGCVPLAERRQTAAPFERAPLVPASEGEAEREARAVDAWLTLAAVLLAGLAIMLAQRGVQSSSTSTRP